MLYPKDVVDFIKNDTILSRRFNDIADDLNATEKVLNYSCDVELWMYSEGVRVSRAVRKYLFFLSSMEKIFNTIHSSFGKTSGVERGRIDDLPAQTSAREMLSIAQYLYYLNSHGIQGSVLECGSFKGFSSCCLSWACHYLNRTLIVADSFQGLPDIGNSLYKVKRGDFKGDFDLVKSNIEHYGNIQNVKFIKGWFNESLRNFKEDLCLLWMDVDLYSSAKDVLQNVFNNLTKGGVVFSHEFSAGYMSSDGVIDEKGAHDVMLALHDYFKENTIPYKAKHLMEDTGIIVPNISKNMNIILHTYSSNVLIDVLNNYSAFDVKILNSIHKRGPTQIAHFILRRSYKNTTRSAYCIDSVGGQNIRYQPRVFARKDEEFTMTGWAIDTDQKKPATCVFIKIGQQYYPAVYGRERVDLAIVYRNEFLKNSGFIAYIPTKSLDVGEYGITIVIVSADGKTYTEEDTGHSITIV